MTKLVFGGVALIASTLAAASIAYVLGSRQSPMERRAIDRATSFLSMLTESQRAKANLGFDDGARTTWAYTPGARSGITLKELDAKQHVAALDLLEGSLSESGYKKVDQIRIEIESVLREMEGNPSRDPELYVLVFYGKPTNRGSWSWRFEGHHVSLDFSFVDGRIVSTTPQFLGSNPAEVRQGPKRGLNPLKLEESIARELLSSLSEDLRHRAILSSTAPADIVTSNLRKVVSIEDKGISILELKDDQVVLLKRLVKLYADVQRPEQSASRLAKIEKHEWSKVKFAWMGSTEPGKPHYYRIQGPTFIIEYDNTQNNANHIHTVWRDFEGDFGRDALVDHYRTSPHHRH